MSVARERARLGICLNLPLSLALRVADEARQRCDPVWIIDSHASEVAHERRILERLGDVVDVAGSPSLGACLGAARVDALVAFTDDRLDEVASAAAERGIAFEEPPVAERLVDKLAQREALAAAGLPGPRFYALEATADAAERAHAGREVGFPAVLKPRRANGSRLTVRLEDTRALDNALAAIVADPDPAITGGFILESLLADPTAPCSAFAPLVSLECAVIEGAVHPIVLSGRRPLAAPFREAGLFIPSDLAPADAAAVIEMGTRAVAALGITRSVLHVEVKDTPAGPRVVEVNGRPGGTVPEVLDRAGARFSLSALALDVALGQAAPPALLAKLPAVGYHLVWPPPVEATRVLAVNGLPEIGALAGVDEVYLNRRPGDSVDWRRGFGEFVFHVAGSAPDHRSFARLAEHIDRTVAVAYEHEDTRRLRCGEGRVPA